VNRDAPILRLVTPAVDHAVDVAMHNADPERFHRQHGTPCELCPEPETELQKEIARKIDELMGDTEMAPWQRKLASEVLAAQMAPDSIEMSDALQTYLDDRSLMADPGEIEDDEDDEEIDE